MAAGVSTRHLNLPILANLWAEEEGRGENWGYEEEGELTSILTTISEALRGFLRKRFFTEVVAEIRGPGTLMRNWALEFSGILEC